MCDHHPGAGWVTTYFNGAAESVCAECQAELEREAFAAVRRRLAGLPDSFVAAAERRLEQGLGSLPEERAQFWRAVATQRAKDRGLIPRRKVE